MASTRTTPPGAPSIPPQALNIIRAAMLAGVVVFAAVAWLLRRSPSPPSIPDATGAILQAIALALALAAGIALPVLRAALGRAADAGQRTRLCIVAYAVAEAPALLGIATFLLTGRLGALLAGAAVFVLALVLVTPRGDGA
jgi:hypothetical protein